MAHTGATSAGRWVKRLGRAEIGRGAATNKPGDIRRGPHGRHVGIACTPWVSCLRGLMSAVDGSPGGGYVRMQFPAEASGAFSREMQSCPHLHLCLSPHCQKQLPQRQRGGAAAPREWWCSWQPLITGPKTRNGPTFNNCGLLKPTWHLDE